MTSPALPEFFADSVDGNQAGTRTWAIEAILVHSVQPQTDEGKSRWWKFGNIPPAKAICMCLGGCAKSYTTPYARDRHWEAYPACEMRHARSALDAAQQRQLYESVSRRRRYIEARRSHAEDRARIAKEMMLRKQCTRSTK